MLKYFQEFKFKTHALGGKTLSFYLSLLILLGNYKNSDFASQCFFLYLEF